MAMLRALSNKFFKFPKSNLGFLSKCAYSDSGNLLIDEPEFAWLKDLGLKADNKGVYNGSWKGNGEVYIWGEGVKYAPVNISPHAPGLGHSRD